MASFIDKNRVSDNVNEDAQDTCLNEEQREK